MGKHESLHDMDPNGMFLDVNVSPRKPKKNPFKIELTSFFFFINKIDISYRAHQSRRSGRLLRLGFNEVAQFLS